MLVEYYSYYFVDYIKSPDHYFIFNIWVKIIFFIHMQKKVTMPYIAGHEEDGFLKSLNLSIRDIEVKAEGCTNILVWHTRTAKNPSRTLKLDNHQTDNIKVLTDNMRGMGMIK